MTNRLFDIVERKVVIHSDMLGIPAYKAIWDNNKDKAHATSLISYVVLKHFHDSPYVISIIDDDVRDATLRKELFKDGWEPTEDVLYAEEMFLLFSNTLSMQLLNSARHALSVITKFYNNVVLEALDMKTVKEAMAGIGGLDKAIQSLDSLAMKVRKEDMGSSSVRGGSEIGSYEIPKSK